ncbi:MAG: DUF3488 and transglutaminase-like domain-containing protein [Tepidisphaeraceae bacterium]
MYNISQFRPMLYTLLLLGFTGYGIAAEAPGLWLVAMGGTLLNAYLVKKKAFKPLPRFVANIVTLLFAALMVLRVRAMPGPAIFAIGEFLTFLQLVKLYEQRGNRDIAQLLVLSLLLMIAAAISTASLAFGVLFIGYLFLSLYCCLLFHLKAESDHAKTVTGLDESKLNPMTLLQDQRFLPRSMRRLAGVVSFVSVGAAVAVFLLFPRGSGAGLIGNLAFNKGQAMTGFNDTVDFQDVARITQNDAQVAWVTIRKNRQPWGNAGELIYLRGSAPDTYVSDPNDSNRWKWFRQASTPSMELPAQPAEFDGDIYEQDIRLLPTGSRTLFALPGLLSLKANRDDLKRATRGIDDVISTFEEGSTERVYSVISSNTDAIPYREGDRRPRGPGDPLAVRTYPVPDEIRQFSLRDEVAGVDDKGNLARQRLDKFGVQPGDETIARNFETYLRNNYQYSLDLTDARLVKDKDPLVQFLYDFKRGHCEYFAGAMALMCQSVGIKARVVVGFKCDEFNPLGQYYVVRQSHAHAWVEALTQRGWTRFDPTSSNEAVASAKKAQSLWQRIKGAFNFLEYKWGNSVVNYDAESQSNVISKAENGLTSTAITTTSWMSDFRDSIQQWFKESKILDLESFYSVLVVLIGTLIVVLSLVVVAIIVNRMRLYRRARRIGLDTLSNNEQRRLARQLAFYDQLLKILERKNIVRAKHLTPQEFGQSIGFLPAEAFDIVQRLTRIFYRIRYGEAELQVAQQKRLQRSVERIETVLATIK